MFDVPPGQVRVHAQQHRRRTRRDGGCGGRATEIAHVVAVPVQRIRIRQANAAVNSEPRLRTRLVRGHDGRGLQAVLPARGGHPEVGAGARVRGLDPVGIERPHRHEVRQVLHGVAVTGYAADLPAQRMQPVAQGEFVARRLDVDRSPPPAQFGGAHFQQPRHVFGGVGRRLLGAETHVEHVNRGRVRRVLAGPQAAQQQKLGVLFRGDADVEAHQRGLGRHATAPEAVAGNRRGHARHARAVIPQRARIVGVGGRGAEQGFVAEIVRAARAGVGGQVRMAYLQPRVQDGQRDARTAVPGSDGRGHAEILPGDAAAVRECRLPGVHKVPLLGEQRIGARCARRSGRDLAARGHAAFGVGREPFEERVEGRWVRIRLRRRAQVGADEVMPVRREPRERQHEFVRFGKDRVEGVGTGRGDRRAPELVHAGEKTEIGGPLRHQVHGLAVRREVERPDGKFHRLAGHRETEGDQRRFGVGNLCRGRFHGRLAVHNRQRERIVVPHSGIAGERAQRHGDGLVALLVEVAVDVEERAGRSGAGGHLDRIRAGRIVMVPGGRAGIPQSHADRPRCGPVEANRHRHLRVVRFKDGRIGRGRERHGGGRRRGRRRSGTVAPSGA